MLGNIVSRCTLPSVQPGRHRPRDHASAPTLRGSPGGRGAPREPRHPDTTPPLPHAHSPATHVTTDPSPRHPVHPIAPVHPAALVHFVALSRSAALLHPVALVRPVTPVRPIAHLRSSLRRPSLAPPLFRRRSEHLLPLMISNNHREVGVGSDTESQIRGLHPRRGGQRRLARLRSQDRVWRLFVPRAT